MPGLFDGLDESRVRHMRCSVAQLLDNLPAEDVPSFQAVMSNERVTSVDIADRLNAGGFYITPATLNRHRKRRCSCDRT
jgi:hypothetical protein